MYIVTSSTLISFNKFLMQPGRRAHAADGWSGRRSSFVVEIVVMKCWHLSSADSRSLARTLSLSLCRSLSLSLSFSRSLSLSRSFCLSLTSPSAFVRGSLMPCISQLFIWPRPWHSSSSHVSFHVHLLQSQFSAQSVGEAHALLREPYAC